MASFESRQAARMWKLKQHYRELAKRYSLDVKIRDSFDTARGWRDCGTIVTCVPDVERPWDPAVMKELWTFDPRLIPLWIKWIWMPPADDSVKDKVIYGYHGLGIRNTNPSGGAYLIQEDVEMPQMPCQGLTFEKPNQVVLIWCNFGDSPDDRPGSYRPFDMSLYYYLRSRFIENETLDELKQREIYDKLDRDKKRQEQVADDLAYRARDFNKYADKQLARMGGEATQVFGNLEHRELPTKPQVQVTSGLPTEEKS